MRTLTKDAIEACESRANSYTTATLRHLGAMEESDIYPKEGWKQRIMFSRISEDSYRLALASRSKAFFREQQEKNQEALF